MYVFPHEHDIFYTIGVCFFGILSFGRLNIYPTFVLVLNTVFCRILLRFLIFGLLLLVWMALVMFLVWCIFYFFLSYSLWLNHLLFSAIFTIVRRVLRSLKIEPITVLKRQNNIDITDSSEKHINSNLFLITTTYNKVNDFVLLFIVCNDMCYVLLILHCRCNNVNLYFSLLIETGKSTYI